MVGMNPGPWGMAQTGIPFGEVNAVRDWLGIRAEITPPRRQHPRRPVMGMDCTRSEVSGQRVWGWAKDNFGTPEAFFKRFLIINYCPLCFMEESGLNRTPDKLAVEEREPLLAACDAALQEMTAYYKPRHVIAIGGFVERRARLALQKVKVKIGRILHPSPASPLANRGWAQQANKQFIAMGI
jgi:single-strand selective monofunctional uracil DNA glycosylase